MGTRPVVLIVVAVLALIEGLGGLALGLVSVRLGRLLGGIGGPLGAVLVVGSALVGLITCVGPILHLVFAWGVLRLRPWAWRVGIAGPVLTVIAVVIVLMSGGNPWRVLPWAIIPLVILTYLSTSDARRALRR
jgi:hypothetical protein